MIKNSTPILLLAACGMLATVSLIIICVVMPFWTQMRAKQFSENIMEQLGFAEQQLLTSYMNRRDITVRQLYHHFEVNLSQQEFELQLDRLQLRPALSNQPILAQGTELFTSINMPGRHVLTQNGNKRGLLKTVEWIFYDGRNNIVIIRFQEVQQPSTLVFDGREIQNNVVTIIVIV